MPRIIFTTEPDGITRKGAFHGSPPLAGETFEFSGKKFRAIADSTSRVGSGDIDVRAERLDYEGRVICDYVYAPLLPYPPRNKPATDVPAQAPAPPETPVAPLRENMRQTPTKLDAVDDDDMTDVRKVAAQLAQQLESDKNRSDAGLQLDETGEHFIEGPGPLPSDDAAPDSFTRAAAEFANEMFGPASDGSNLVIDPETGLFRERRRK